MLTSLWVRNIALLIVVITIAGIMLYNTWHREQIEPIILGIVAALVTALLRMSLIKNGGQSGNISERKP